VDRLIHPDPTTERGEAGRKKEMRLSKFGIGSRRDRTSIKFRKTGKANEIIEANDRLSKSWWRFS